MSDVVIVGGGLSGLAAAYQLEQLGVDYTLIEVKRRLGGGIVSAEQDGFIVDGGAMLFPCADDWDFLAEVGLPDALFAAGEGAVGFERGTNALVAALEASLRGSIMRRMAVSSLGRGAAGFSVCFENGLMLETRAVIVAAPARYAERMLRTLAPEAALTLLQWRYANHARVSLGYRRDALGDLPPIDLSNPDAKLWTGHPTRVPNGHVLLQARVPYDPANDAAEAVVARLQGQMNWPQRVALQRLDYWAESSPIPPRDRTICLPPGIELAGSDYWGDNLSARMAHGRSLARRVAAWLNGR